MLNALLIFACFVMVFLHLRKKVQIIETKKSFRQRSDITHSEFKNVLSKQEKSQSMWYFLSGMVCAPTGFMINQSEYYVALYATFLTILASWLIVAVTIAECGNPNGMKINQKQKEARPD